MNEWMNKRRTRRERRVVFLVTKILDWEIKTIRAPTQNSTDIGPISSLINDTKYDTGNTTKAINITARAPQLAGRRVSWKQRIRK